MVIIIVLLAAYIALFVHAFRFIGLIKKRIKDLKIDIPEQPFSLISFLLRIIIMPIMGFIWLFSIARVSAVYLVIEDIHDIITPDQKEGLLNLVKEAENWT